MTACTCPRCGNRHRCTDDDLDAQIAARVAAWTAQCEKHGWPIKQGRVSESVAAELIGMELRTLRDWRVRQSERAPPYERIPVVGSQYSYDLTELAAWKATRQIGDSWRG